MSSQTAGLPSRLKRGSRLALVATGVLAVIVAANTLYLLVVRAGVVVTGQGVTGSRVFQVLLLSHPEPMLSGM